MTSQYDFLQREATKDILCVSQSIHEQYRGQTSEWVTILNSLPEDQGHTTRKLKVHTVIGWFTISLWILNYSSKQC